MSSKVSSATRAWIRAGRPEEDLRIVDAPSVAEWTAHIEERHCSRGAGHPDCDSHPDCPVCTWRATP